MAFYHRIIIYPENCILALSIHYNISKWVKCFRTYKLLMLTDGVKESY